MYMYLYVCVLYVPSSLDSSTRSLRKPIASMSSPTRTSRSPRCVQS